MRGLWAALPALLIQSAHGQQPAGTQMFVNYPGLSDGCKEALATNVTCPPFLPAVSQDNAILDDAAVGELCVDSCYSSLNRARATIQAACTASTDVIVYEDVAYPGNYLHPRLGSLLMEFLATFIADNYLLTFEVSCKKDKEGNYCDPLFLSWQNHSVIPSVTAACSDCSLGVLEVQLNHPLGYDEGMEERFNSLTSSCGVTGYSVTSPAPYALNATATATSVITTATSKPACDVSYVVKPSDDCNSVAKSLSVSTYSLLHANYLDLYCQTFSRRVGKTLCVPPKCTTHTWQASDTCDSVVGGLGNVTLPQFLAWNPNFNSLCLNSPFFIGYEVCISPPGGYLNHTSNDNSSPTVTAGSSGVAAFPTNAVDGSSHNCSLWYTVVEGDECGLVTLAQSISLTDFYFLNPEIDENCSNLQLSRAYCVRPVGSITSYPNYTITGVLPITVPPATFSSVNTAIPTSTNDPGYEYIEPPLLPTAPGTIRDCYLYQNSPSFTTLCRDLARDNDVSGEDLAEWNPSLEKDMANCTLTSTYSYCVKKYENSTSTEDISSYCLPIDATEAGTVSNCNCFTSIDGYDAGDYTCADMAVTYGVKLVELLAWNSWLSGDCDSALFANLNSTSRRAVCIGVGSKSATATTTTSTRSGTATSATESMVPTQTGVVSGCQLFHTVVDGDDCPLMESKYGITLAQLYQWNPSISSTCNNLWLGYAYCVKGPGSSTTPTATSSNESSSGPTQTGTASKCNQYHTVVSGDSCDHIETTYGISFAQLYEWNPEIGSNCQTLRVGYSVCVAVSSASAPTQPGIASDCNRYYTVVSGDSCDGVETNLHLFDCFPTNIGRALHPVKRQYFHQVRAMMNIPDNFRPGTLSERDPTREASSSNADKLERLLQMDGFKTWGFVIYRCTYQSDSDWEKFMTRFLSPVTESLEYYKGLDLLDSFAPTVFEDRSFDGATTSLVREHFQEWAATAPQVEQPVGYSCLPESGRYKFFIMVDQESLESVLNAPDPDDWNDDGFVRLVDGFWEPEELDKDELAELGVSSQLELEQEEPLEGCTLEDVGWMKVVYYAAETYAKTQS
ncbi:hypothetical protein ABOM_000718 [Aspergillus bombycis]|uniref:LysM domain-containing protein n=1 Tax=Aspergillus bombycis TaxID=109264 RepID=A0A1F8AI00_9EURO|nr:hypothetical protein ABOM_000718 [Aspergillus bombycis]OGM50928.1 hypothetical protein ABOM_000718 [Aspergillus bombycis]